jgi:hypothetical protein
MPLREAADRVCGKRLKALIPALIDAMERQAWRTSPRLSWAAFKPRW